MSQWCAVCTVHEYNFVNCDRWDCPLLHVRLAIELGRPEKEQRSVRLAYDNGGAEEANLVRKELDKSKSPEELAQRWNAAIAGPNDVQISEDVGEHQDKDDSAQ
jgi:hypothetical protein